LFLDQHASPVSALVVVGEEGLSVTGAVAVGGRKILQCPGTRKPPPRDYCECVVSILRAFHGLFKTPGVRSGARFGKIGVGFLGPRDSSASHGTSARLWAVIGDFRATRRERNDAASSAPNGPKNPSAGSRPPPGNSVETGENPKSKQRRPENEKKGHELFGSLATSHGDADYIRAAEAGQSRRTVVTGPALRRHGRTHPSPFVTGRFKRRSISIRAEKHWQGPSCSAGGSNGGGIAPFRAAMLQKVPPASKDHLTSCLTVGGVRPASGVFLRPRWGDTVCAKPAKTWPWPELRLESACFLPKKNRTVTWN